VSLDKDTIALILNQLRKASIIWSGRKMALDKARVKLFEKYTKDGQKKLYKFYWKCSNCKQLFRNQSQVEVDHIKEIGSFTGDWNEFIDKLFCNHDNLQVLCVICHLKKTSGYNASMRYERKKKDDSENY